MLCADGLIRCFCGSCPDPDLPALPEPIILQKLVDGFQMQLFVRQIGPNVFNFTQQP
jgi:hypothetical protein